MTRIAQASVHGRFQPLHLQHLEYLTAAFDAADFLYIGITQFERANLLPVAGADQHRVDPAANPLTFFERAQVLRLAVAGEGISSSRFTITPFPIERPEALIDFLPVSIPILTTRVDPWNDAKADLLTAAGYEVEVLYERDPKGMSGSQIRELISSDDSSWTDFVPKSTVAYLKSLDLGTRIRFLANA